MNPNKKSLNSKNNSPWLLCPSKSFPGKFYYFNGSTGETAWSLTESDHNNLKKHTIHKVSDNGHPYPEPFGPPGDESTNTSTSSTLKKKEFINTNFNNTSNFNKTSVPNISTFSKGTNFNFTHHRFGLASNQHGQRNFNNFSKPSEIGFQPASPMFGQANFPTYVSNKGPKVIWALTPMFVNDQQQEMIDQITQYETPNTFLQPPLVLNNQFQSFKQINPFKANPTPKVVQTGMPMFATKVTYESKDVQTFDLECKTKDEACQTLEPKTIEVQTEPIAKPVLRPSKFVEKPPCSGISNLSLGEGVEDAKEIEDDANKLSDLKENDLRFLLVAKRRKSVDLGEVLKSTTTKESPKIQSEEKTPKKRVTFYLGDKGAESVIQDNVTPDQKCASTSSVEALKSSNSDRIWYIVADSKILMTDYDYVKRNILNGRNCRLLVPYVVKADIEATSRGECRGKQDVFVARLVARKLTTPSPYIVLQRKPETTSSCDEYSILDCCCQYSRDDCDLTLLTTSPELFEKARLIGIDCSLYDPRRETIDTPINDAREEEALDNTLVSKTAITDKSIEFTNTYKSVDDDYSEPLDLDISKLDITDQRLSKKNENVINVYNNKPTDAVNYSKVQNDIKVSGITKLNNVFNLADELARYCVKNEVMEARLVSRIDEWNCRLFLATEGALIDTLLKEKVKKGLPPQNFREAIEKIGTAFEKQSKIRTIVEKLSSHLKDSKVDVTSKYNKTKPADFIKLLGFCMILIQSLKEVVDYVELNDADDLLSELIKHIEDPNTDVEFNLDKVPILGDKEFENKVPVGYKTKQSDVLEYLKKHFVSMQSYEFEKTEPNIVRTVGKDLKSIKVYNTKAIVMDNTDLKTDLTPTIVEPVVLKNFKIIEAFEENIKKQNEDIFDYVESLSTIFSGDTYVVKDNIDSTYKKNENIDDGRNISATDSVVGESLSSDLNNECIYALPLMKAFLTELRRTLILIFNFVSDSKQDLQQNSMSENKRSDLEIKMSMAHKYILKIISRLKSIISREASQDETVRMLLIQAGDYVEEDETMSHYKELIIKYLKQAEILEGALKIMMTIEHGDLDGSQ